VDKSYLETAVERKLSIDAISEEAGKSPSTVWYWLKKHDIAPAFPKFARTVQPPPCERLLDDAREMGSITRLAAHYEVDRTTMRHWLENAGVEGPFRAWLRDLRDVDGVVTGVCREHGRTPFMRRSDGHRQCKLCACKAVMSSRRRTKAYLASHLGGTCWACGYDRYLGALDFHHLDPATKSFGLAAGQGLARSKAVLIAEAEKCALLCRVCHAEVEGGVRECPTGHEGRRKDWAQP